MGCSVYAGGGSSVDVLGAWRVAMERLSGRGGALFWLLSLMMVIVEADSDSVSESAIVSFSFVSRETLSWTEELCDVLVASIL